MFAIPPLVWLGMPLANAIAIVMSASFIQSAWASYHLRSDIKLPVTLPFVIIRNLVMPIGVLILRYINKLDQSTTAQLIGIVLLIIVVILWMWKVQPVDHIHVGWGIGTSLSSGLMAGMFGMGGPPLVLWVMAHNWTNRQTRAFLLFNVMATSPLQLGVLWLMIGSSIGNAILWGLAFSPVVLIGAQIGLWCGQAISRTWLQKVAYSLLVLLACCSILVPLVKDHPLPIIERSVSAPEESILAE